MNAVPARPQQMLSPLTTAILALIQGLLPAMTAIIGGLWVAFTYLVVRLNRMLPLSVI
jgi:hypothetical protein